jgi:DNA gyrase/topoisomerase IV subunit A
LVGFLKSSTKRNSETKGIIKRQDKEASDALRCAQCPHCLEICKRDARFCTKCKMVLKYDAYIETIEESKRKQSEIQDLKENFQKDIKQMNDRLDNKINQIMCMIQQNPKLVYVKPDALTKEIDNRPTKSLDRMESCQLE